jgi:hypothetical protein
MSNQPISPDQIALFEAIRSKTGKQGLAETIRNLLKTSITPAYKRISGEVLLTLPELKIIRNHFGISIDAILDGSATGNPKIHIIPVDVSDMESCRNFLKWLIDKLDKLNMGEMKFTYTAHDIPVYHICPYHELAFFASFPIEICYTNRRCRMPTFATA